MPITNLKIPSFKPPKEAVATWNNWRKGLNLLLRPSELARDELVEASNLILVGSGVPTKRWGSQDHFLAGATGTGNFLFNSKDSTDVNHLLAMTDWGYLTKKNGASYTMITGYSWPSGSRPEAAQLGGNVYLVSPEKEFARYNFTTLTGFSTVATPAGLSATNFSGASGTTVYSWRVSAGSTSGGETTASTAAILTQLPQVLTQTMVRLTWTPVSTLTGIVSGYNIYRGVAGLESWVGGVDSNTFSFDDFGDIGGTATGDPLKTVPTTNTTGGVIAKYIIRFQDRLVLAGISGHPTRVLVSGRYPIQERFDYLSGGGSVDIEPDSGDNITGLTTYKNASTSTQTIIVFKEKSVWEVSLDTKVYGTYALLFPSYRLLTASQGCSSHRSIASLENDIIFSNRLGIYILRYEPQLINVINANEISAKIKPFFEGLTDDDKTHCAGIYANKKYILSFPTAKQHIIFDRERLCFMGPWTTPFGIRHWAKYVDTVGDERYVGIDANGNYVVEFGADFIDDRGTAFGTTLKTKKEDFGDWTLIKTINEIFLNFSMVSGSISINVYVEDRDGNTVIAKSFTLTGSGASGNSGMGIDQLGTIQMGLTSEIPETSPAESPKKAYIYKSSRQVQLEIRTSDRSASYELLGAKIIAIPQGRGNAPSSWSLS